MRFKGFFSAFNSMYNTYVRYFQFKILLFTDFNCDINTGSFKTCIDQDIISVCFVNSNIHI